MIKVKTATEKTQFTKVKKAVTTQNNIKRTFTKKREKIIHKKGKLNEMLDIITATQGNEGCIPKP